MNTDSLALKTEYQIREYVRRAIVGRWGKDFPPEFVIEIKSSV